MGVKRILNPTNQPVRHCVLSIDCPYVLESAAPVHCACRDAAAFALLRRSQTSRPVMFGTRQTRGRTGVTLPTEKIEVGMASHMICNAAPTSNLGAPAHQSKTNDHHYQIICGRRGCFSTLRRNGLETSKMINDMKKSSGLGGEYPQLRGVSTLAADLWMFIPRGGNTSGAWARRAWENIHNCAAQIDLSCRGCQVVSLLR